MTSTKLNSSKNFQKRVLNNGITLLHEQRDLPVVTVSIANPFAASHETDDIKGIAHFIEHLVFTGTKTRSHEDISREIEKRGGILNAFTAHDVTAFWFKLPAEHIITGLDILSDMLLEPTFEKEKFEKEKKVILEEIKLYHDDPAKNIYDKILENLYEKPFGSGIIGSEKTINALDRDFVFDYFKKHYLPQNYIVTIVGNANLEEICAYLEEKFKATEEKMPGPLPIKEKNAVTVEERAGIDQAHFMFAVHAPKATHDDLKALEVLNAYLASGMSSKLFLEIREKRGLAYTVAGSLNTEKNYSYYSIYVGTTKQAVDEVKKMILQGFKDLIENMTESDVEDAKQQLIGLRQVTAEESVRVMNELLFEEIATGNAEAYYNHEAEIRKVTLDQVKKLANIAEHSTAAIVPCDS